jgi:hypothetical protein
MVQQVAEMVEAQDCLAANMALVAAVQVGIQVMVVLLQIQVAKVAAIQVVVAMVVVEAQEPRDMVEVAVEV